MGEFIAYKNGKDLIPVSPTNPLPVTGGGAGGTTPSTVADGADVALGATADASASSDTGTFSLIALTKRLLAKITAGVTVISYQGTITATVVTLAAATSSQLIASNSSRKGLRWQNIGVNPATIVPGASAAVVGQGFQYGGAAGTGLPGDGESFEGNSVPTNAFQAISTLGTTVVIWEQT